MPDFPNYAPAVADAMLDATELIEVGLMGFLAIRHVSFGPGTMVAEIDVRDDLLTPFGTLHGGVISALADHVLGSVMYPVMERGQWAATTEFKINLLRPVREGVLAASAEIISMSRRMAVIRIDITNPAADGSVRLAGAAQGTVSIQDPR